MQNQPVELSIFGKPRLPRLNKVVVSRAERRQEATLSESDVAGNCVAEAEQFAPGDFLRQLNRFLAIYRIPSQNGRTRTVSYTTVTRYEENLSAFFNTLCELNVRLRNLSDPTPKHLRMAFTHWEGKGLSSSTLANRHTVLRRFFAWIGKPDVPTLTAMLADPKRAARTGSATQALDWENNGVDLEETIQEIAKDCRYTAMHLWLQREFGLRSAEALQLKPRESDEGTVLLVTRGTKGGKGRVVPIRTERQRELLDQAKAMAGRNGLINRAGVKGELARNHYYYILKKYGITRADQGVTPHGLRHGYAHERYTELTGEMPPVSGTPVRDRKVDHEARSRLSLEMGHVRPHITGAYIGPTKRTKRYVQRNIETVLKPASDKDVRSSMDLMRERLKPHGWGFSLYIAGAEAKGFLPGKAHTLRCLYEITDATLTGRKPDVENLDWFKEARDLLLSTLEYAYGRPVMLFNIAAVGHGVDRIEVLI